MYKPLFSFITRAVKIRGFVEPAQRTAARVRNFGSGTLPRPISGDPDDGGQRRPDRVV